MADSGENQNHVEGDVSRNYGESATALDRTRSDPRMWAAFGLFFILAFAFASWLPRLPELKRAFGMSEGDVGFVLLAMPVAQLCVIPLVAYGSIRLRLRTLNLICITWLLVAISLVGLTTSPISLARSSMSAPIEGRRKSASINRVRRPKRANSSARIRAVVDLPSPAFELVI